MVTRGTKWRVGFGLFVSLIVVSGGSAVFLISHIVRGQRFLAEAYVALQKGDCKTALPKFEAASRFWLGAAQLSYALANRGHCYNMIGRSEDALRDYDEAIRLNPKFAWAFQARGLLRDYKGEPDKALPDYSKAIQLDPNSAEALYRRGLIFLSRQQTDDAIVDLREAIRARPGTAHFYLSLGEACWQKNDLPAAIANFEAVIGINPRDPAAYRKRAAIFALRGEEKEAAADTARAQFLEKILSGSMQQMQPSDLFREAYWAAELGNHDVAVEVYGQLLGTKLSRENASVAYQNRGSAYIAQGENEKALRDFALALEANPKNAGVYVNRASIALERNELDRAIADCTQAAALNPELEEAYLNRADAYGRKRDFARAIADLKKAIALKGKRLETAFNRLAWIRATSPEKSIRNGREAVDAATRACELTNWQDPGVIDTLAAAYAEHGQFERAVETQARALADQKLPAHLRREMEDRLKQYGKREAYREAPKP
jgi:tetratricopeptide (TPR) repeat protein